MHFQQIKATLQGMTGKNRPIRLSLSGRDGPVDDLLLVKHVDGHESVCGGIEYRLLCVGSEAGLPLKQFNAMAAELEFVTDTGNLHSVCGIVASAAEGESDGGLATYQLVIRDALSIIDARVNTRVFRNASEVDITNTLLREWLQNNPVLARAFDFKWLITGSYPPQGIHDAVQRIRLRIPAPPVEAPRARVVFRAVGTRRGRPQRHARSPARPFQ